MGLFITLVVGAFFPITTTYYMRTTLKDFEYFKKRCEYWLRFFNFDHWDFICKHVNESEVPGFVGGYAASQITWNNYRIVVYLHQDWSNGEGVRITKKALDSAALHEILHIIFYLKKEKAIEYLVRIFHKNKLSTGNVKP